MKKLFIILLLGIFLISFASSLEFDNIKTLPDISKDIYIGDKLIEYNELWEKYPVVEIDNWLGLGETLFSGALTEHTESCGNNCFSELEVYLANDGVLISDMNFKKKLDSGEWIDSNIQSYKLFYQSGTNYENIDDYEYQCFQIGINKNGTAINECSYIKIGSHLESKPIWTEFVVGDIFQNGNYKIKIEGTKKLEETYDWIPTIAGKEINELAIWGSFYINSSNLVSWWYLDETVGNDVIDSKQRYNLTRNNGTIGVTGKIGTAYSFNRNVEYLNSTQNIGITNYPFTLAMWANASNTGYEMILGGFGSTSDDDIDYSIGVRITTGNLFILARDGVGGGHIDSTASTVNISDGSYHHIVAVFNSSTDRKIYKDGISVLNQTTEVPYLNTDINFFIGSSYNLGNYFDGYIDEFSVWNKSLNTTDITKLYNLGAGTRILEAVVTLNSPENTSNISLQQVTTNSSAIVFETNIVNVTLWDNRTGTWEARNTTIKTGTTNTTSFTNTYLDGSYLWNHKWCDSDGDCGFATSNYTFNIDTTKPQISVEAPSDTLNYGLVGGNETLNITFTDANLDSCWYNYNGTNITIAGCLTGIKNSTNFLLELGNTNMTIYANDSLGNENSTFISWDYYVLEISQSFSTQVTEGITTRISSNLTLSSGQRLSSADLNYNGTLYSGSTNEYSTNNWFVYYDLNVPQVSTDTNITFFWNLTFEDDTTLLTQLNNQTILNIAIDNCSSYTNTLFNFSVLDEDTQTILNATGDNVSIIVDLSFYNPNNNELIFNFSQEYKQTNPARVCVEDSLVEETYRLDGVVQYSANNRFKEFYNFQNYSLNNETDATLINLYDLNSTLGQEFKITYKDENFNTVPGAVIQIQRKYIGEGVFKVVELPLFGSQGYAIAHLIRDDVIYNFIILEDGEVLGTFENIVANCQNPTISDCEININSFSSTVSPEDFSNDGAFVAKLTYNSTSRVVSTTYSITSGAPEQTNLNVTLWDSYLNQSVCSDGLYSAGGTLSCTIPAQFGNTTVYIELSSDSDVKRTAVFILNTDPQSIYGANLIFLSLCIMLFIIGMSTSDNPLTLGIMLIVGTIILITLNMVSSLGWFGQGATILWLIVAIAIILIKGSNRQ